MRTDRLRERLAHRLEGLAKRVRPKPTVHCTGVAASWCPIHGDCVCTPRCPICGRSGPADIQDRGDFNFYCGSCNEAFWNDSDVDRNDDACPLHSATSSHAESGGAR